MSGLRATRQRGPYMYLCRAQYHWSYYYSILPQHVVPHPLAHSIRRCKDFSLPFIQEPPQHKVHSVGAHTFQHNFLLHATSNCRMTCSMTSLSHPNVVQDNWRQLGSSTCSSAPQWRAGGGAVEYGTLQDAGQGR
jgi:hypothetical protein